MECEATQRGGAKCNGPAGHDGPHGLYLDGLIFTPWNGPTNESPEPCDVACDCCGQPMTVTRTQDGATLDCTACDQRWWFGNDGNSSRTIVACLWPSYPSPRYWREQILPGWKKERLWTLNAQRATGCLDANEHARRLRELDAQVEEARQSVLPFHSRWWQLWRTHNFTRGHSCP